MAKAPKLQHHKATGQARVRIDGKDHYLGPYGSLEATQRYEALIIEWRLRRSDDPDVQAETTIAELALAFMKHAETYYVAGGEQTGEAENCRIALREVVRMFHTAPAVAFGPKKLKQVRDSLIKFGLARNTINARVNRIRRAFKWAASEELIPGRVYVDLMTVEGLKQNRSQARETEPVKAVPDDRVDAIRPFVTSPVWGLVQLQRFTGMRPGEAVIIRGCDLNMSGRIWEYKPSRHKTLHRGKSRLIQIGPRGQEVIRDFLKPDIQGYLFSPQDAIQEFVRREYGHQARARPVGEKYTVDSYGDAILRACERAFKCPEELRQAVIQREKKRLSDRELKRRRKLASEWRRQHAWTPNQVRHNAATTIRREFGIEAVRVILGHSKVETSEIYAERDMDAARDIAGRIG